MKRTASDLSTIRTASNLSTIQFRLIFKGHKSLEYWCLVIDRFHSRDRWPQWGGETIRNI